MFVNLSIIIFYETSCVLLLVFYYLFVELSIIIFCEISCVLLDSNIYVVKENQYMDNFLVFHYG